MFYLRGPCDLPFYLFTPRVGGWCCLTFIPPNVFAAEASAPSPTVAAIWGFFIPGAGQIYAGDIFHGVLVLSLCLVNLIIFGLVINIATGGVITPCVGVAHLALVIWGSLAGWQTARKRLHTDDVFDSDNQIGVFTP